MNGTDFSAFLGKYIGMMALFVLLLTAAIVFYVTVIWRLFEKLEYSGWVGLIPFVNLYVLYKTAKMRKYYVPTLFLLLAAPVFVWILFEYPSPSLMLIISAIPTALALILLWVRLAVGLSYAFDKEAKFTAFMVALPMIFVPVLALSNTRYFAKM